MTSEQFKAFRTAEDNLTAVLCDPKGKCCISESVSDLRIIDDALDILRALAAEPAPEPLTDEQIASMVSALNVYADPSFYHACTVMFDPPTGGFDEDFSFDAEYGRDMPGKLARETLDAIDTAKAQEQKP